MKHLLTPFAAILLSCSCKNFELPKNWGKNFNITLYEGGGMNYESTTIYLSTDSCKYVRMEDGKDDIKRFKLSAKEQEEVSAKLNSFNVGSIESIEQKGLAHDKETNRLCFYLNAKEQHCVESGATININKKCREDFNNAYQYIIKLANEKSK